MSEEIIKMVFSNNLKKYMEMRGVSQTDIMRKLNIPSATISSWVNGKRMPRMNKIQELADYLHVSKSNLIENVVLGNFKTEEEAKEFQKEFAKNPMIIFKDMSPLNSTPMKNENRNEELPFILPVSDFAGNLYHKENSKTIKKFFDGEITPQNITDKQIIELEEAVEKNSKTREYWIAEKEKWAIEKISEYLKKLSPEGQEEAVTRIEELTHNKRFKKLELMLENARNDASSNLDK